MEPAIVVRVGVGEEEDGGGLHSRGRDGEAVDDERRSRHSLVSRDAPRDESVLRVHLLSDVDLT